MHLAQNRAPHPALAHKKQRRGIRLDSILSQISSPEDLKRLNIAQLEQLSGEIRQVIIDTVSQQGGHLASNLGIIELTIALHSVFESPRDKIIFDVGHQAYVHKLLTGRKAQFGTLRSYGGISGFPRSCESEHDIYDTGHSSTAISCALGLARARDLRAEDYHVVAVVGDGAMTGGMCYEAMNDAGSVRSRLIVILNDNEMSISKNVGALATHLTRLRASAGWRGTKKAVKHGLERIPAVGPGLARHVENFKNTFKHFFTHGELFEALGFRYLGPIDGHDISTLMHVLSEAKQVTDMPLLIHVITQKGHGYDLAERKPEKFHGIAPFFSENGVKRQADTQPGAAQVVGETLVEMAWTDERIVAITAAMAAGTGLSAFARQFPNRFFDVGIAEEHALTMSSGLAKGGMKPYFVVYSTFLQRGYDQLLHDICLQKLPVRILIDHAGLVGEDGATHHGIFDLAFLNTIPGMTVLAPRDVNELRAMLHASTAFDGPCAIRYFKEGIDMSTEAPYAGFTSGRWETLREGDGPVIVAHGRMVSHALAAAELLKKDGVHCGIINASTLKPIDTDTLDQLCRQARRIIVLEETVPAASLGESVCCYLQSKRQGALLLDHICLPDAFVTHGSMEALLTQCGLMPESIAVRILRAIKE